MLQISQHALHGELGVDRGQRSGRECVKPKVGHMTEIKWITTGIER